MKKLIVLMAITSGLAIPVLPLLFSAQNNKSIAIRWYGQSCFQVTTTTGKKIVFDPHAIPTFDQPKPEADLLLITHEHDDHNLGSVLPMNAKRVERRALKPLGKGTGRFDWNKIDETVDGVKIKTFGTFHDDEDGKKRGKNGVFVITVDGLTICHLGDLGHELTEEQVKLIGPVDILLIPVGGIYTINGAQAKKVVEALKPRLYTIPMHYGVEGYDDLLTAAEFLEDQTNVEKLTTSNLLTIPTDLKLEKSKIALLGYKPADKK